MNGFSIITRVGPDGQLTLQLPLEYAGCQLRLILPDLKEVGTEIPVIKVMILKTREELAAEQAVIQAAVQKYQGSRS
jgi:hypothetical protein